MTKREATEKWVGEFNAIPHGMIEALWTHAGQYEGADWQEVTKPRVGDTVWSNDHQETGEIVHIYDTGEPEADVRFGDTVETLSLDDISVEYDSLFPMWGTMWSFGNSMDDYWLDELDGLQIMSDHGFRIYEHEEFGYFFGIDGAGYSFYDHHWSPLYEARGLQWHEKEIDQNLSLSDDLETSAEKSKEIVEEQPPALPEGMQYTQDFYNYLQENFILDGTVSRLVHNILEYVEAENFIDVKDARTHLWSLLGGAFGLTEKELLHYQASEDVLAIESSSSALNEADKMTVLLIEAGKVPREAEIENGLASLQKTVGGSIQAVYPYAEPVALICHEEGKILGLPLNRALYDGDGNMYDIVAGGFIICGLSDDNFVSLSPEDMEKFKERFQAPEEFAKINGKIVAIKMEPEKSPLRETLAKHAERSRAEFGDQASTPQKAQDAVL